MADHHRTRPADPTTTANANRDPSMVPVFTTEMYEAAFSTQGSHPMGGVAMARTLEEARQQLADMLIFADPTAPATAEIIAFHRGLPVEGYDGTAGDIFQKGLRCREWRRLCHPGTRKSTRADAEFMTPEAQRQLLRGLVCRRECPSLRAG